MHDNFLKGLAEAIIPFLMPYVENKVKDELSNLPTLQKDKPEFLTKKQVMSKYQISAMTLWRLEQNGTLIPVRVGSKVMYRVEDLANLYQ